MNRSEEIQSLTKFGTENFNFMDTFYDLVGNRGFGEGYNRPNENDKYYIWHVLSAIGNSIGNVMYSNVLHYTDLVANVDTCKTKQLQSFLNLFGLDMCLLDSSDGVPSEVISLIDTLSISKRYLLKNPIVSEELTKAIKSYRGEGNRSVVQKTQYDVDWYYRNIPNSFTIGKTNNSLVSSVSTDCDSVYGDYELTYDFDYTIDGHANIGISDFMVMRVYKNDNNMSLVKITDHNKIEHYILSSNNLVVGRLQTTLGDRFEDSVNINENTRSCTFHIDDIDISSVHLDGEFLRRNNDAEISVLYVPNKNLSVDNTTYSDEDYYDFVKICISDLIYHFVSLPYNTRLYANGVNLSSKPIYSYQNFWDEYHVNDNGYEQLDDSDNDIAQLKRVYGIDAGFDEKVIVDNIENGEDDVSNYSENQRVILSSEMERRQSMLDFSGLGYNIQQIQSGDGQKTSYEAYTRYSYYRYQKVLEYVNFVEHFMYMSEEQLANIKEYSYDKNYFIKNSTDKVDLFTKLGSSVQLNTDLICKVSEQIANVIQYICHLRERLKIQIRKNYSKGTSNLLRYVVNEYVQDFGRNCGYFKDQQYQNFIEYDTITLSDIYNKLINHSIDDVEVVEYVDTTEYFNIENENTSKSSTNSSYNPDYFAEYFKYDENSGKVVQTKEPYELDYEEIRNFYISSLVLDQVLDNEDELNSFLSVVYDVGKSRRYIDSDLSIMVCKLSDGRNSRDMYVKSQNLTECLHMIDRYLAGSGYEFAEQPVSSQIPDILDNVVYVGLSDQYLSGCSELYDKYIDEINAFTTSVQTLADSYNKLLTSDYAYYYTKSSVRYCYTDNDPDNGTYKHDYLYDNPSYNTSYLYEKLNNLKSYSSGTNLNNHSIIDTAEYFEEEFGKIYYSYTGTIRPALESYGYTEKTNDSFGDTLTQAASFAETQKQNLANDAKSLWAEFKTTFNELKSTYDQLNGKCIALKAKYVGEEYTKYMEEGAYAFSDTKIESKQREYTWDISEGEKYDLGEPTGYCRKSDKPQSKGTDFNFTVNVNGTNIYFYRKSGDTKDFAEGIQYPYWIQDDTEYNETDPLASRLESLRKFADSVIFLRLNINKDVELISPSTGTVMTVGSSEEATTLLTQVDELDTKYETLEARMIAAGCDWDCGETTIEDKLEKLSDYISGHGSETITGSSERLTKLNEFIALLENYSSSYKTMQSDYTSVKSQTGISDYLGSKDPGQYVNMTTIRNLISYAETKDLENASPVQDSIEELLRDYDKLLQSVQDLVYRIRIDLKTLVVDDQFVESYLSTARAKLENDRDSKFEEGMYYVSKGKRQAQEDFEKAEGYLSGYVSSTDPLTAVLQEMISKNDIMRNEEYLKSLNEFRTYTNTVGSYQGYYNRKNITHPTRQAHPFMWNFIKYVADSTNTDKVFYSYQVSELESSKSEQYIDKIVGETGNLINVWKYSIQDFSGYTTRYVANSNVTDKSTQIFEVAEYDGAFYPPAIEQYRKDYTRCIRSLKGQVKVDTICNKINNSDSISYYLSDYISVDTIDTLGSKLYGIVHKEFDEYLIDNNLCAVVQEFANGIETLVLSDDITGEEKVTTKAKRQDFIDYLEDNLNKTFFERFYSCLELTEDNIDFIARQLENENIRSRIYEITDDQTKANLYDIYDYDMDQFNNVYILYKNYGDAHPTFKQKRNTLGQVWVRFNDHPIAFPLVSENKEDIDLSQMKMDSDTNRYLRDILFNEGITRNYCYQLQFTYDRKIIAMVCKKTKSEMGRDVDPMFESYEYASTVMSVTDIAVDDKRGFNRLTLTNNDGAFDDIITGADKNGFELPDETDIRKDIYSLIGIYSPSGDKMNLVYVKKRLEWADENSLYRYIATSYPEISIQKFDSNTQGLDQKNNTIDSGWDTGENNQSATNHRLISDVVFSYNKTENQLTFCFVRNIMGDSDVDLDRKKKTRYQNEIDLITGTEGGTIKDSSTKQMNSFDIFIQNICVMTTTSPGSKLKMLSYTENNINADMSFIPVYPDKYNCANIEGDDKQYGCYNIELLGKSKNIDRYIDNTNPNPDPNFNLDSFVGNKKFGRVYEDYLEEYDKTFVVTENEALNSNMDKYCRKEGGNVISFTWQFDIEQRSGKEFSDGSIDDFKIMIFNKNTLGKNPYYFGDLTALNGGRWADYTSFINDQKSNERIYTDDTLLEGQMVTVVGQNKVDGSSTSIENNQIYNISGIKFEFDKKKRTLTTTFVKTDCNIDSSVNKDTIRYLMFNTRDITVFEYYHLLDQYGLVNVRYGEIDSQGIGRIIHNGWMFVYDTSRYSKDYLEDAVNAYYMEGLAKKDMNDVQLSNYDCLSDVYVFRDYNRLAFKYSSEDIFHMSAQNYYFPTLNVKYPFTTGQFISEQVNNISQGDPTGENRNDIFGTSEVYVINFAENNGLRDEIGNVDIPRMYNYDDCVIAFEDYLDIPASLRPDYHDARALQYIKFNTPDSSTICLSDDLDISSIGVETSCRTTNEVLEDLAGLDDGKSELFILSSEHSTLSSQTRYVRVNLSGRKNNEDGSTSERVSIEGLADLNVNYKREDDLQGITLYFNYNNYINSPFIKIDSENNVLIDTIDQTYLKLKSGESGYLDIVIQVKYSEQGRLIGYTNLNLVRYRIFNISDDKPKFVVRIVNKIQKDDYAQGDSRTKTCSLGVDDITLTQKQLIPYQNDKYQTDIVVRAYSDDSTMKSLDYYIFFPSSIFGLDTTRSSRNCSVTYAGDGCVHVTSDAGPDKMTIPIITVSNAFDLLVNNTDTYEIFIDEASVFDNTGSSLFVNTTSGIFRVADAGSTFNTILIDDKDYLVSPAWVGGSEGQINKEIRTEDGDRPILTRSLT